MEKIKYQLVFVIILLVLSAAGCQPASGSPVPSVIPKPSATPVPIPTITPTSLKPTPVVEGTPVPFEIIDFTTIVERLNYENKTPSLVVLTQISDIFQIQGVVTPQPESKLQFDFSEYIGVAVFQGWKPTNGYGVDIQTVTRVDERILIYADFIEPPRTMELQDIVTSPNQLIEIRKEGLDDTLIFELIVDGVRVQQTEVIINID